MIWLFFLFIHAARASCGLDLLTPAGVWNYPTSRSYTELEGELKQMNEALSTPKLELQDVIAGRKSLLILGEGDSEFVGHLLTRASRKNKKPQIHAVDIAYAREESWRTQPYLTRYPENYHAQLFQKLKLDMQFDEIVSPYALGFILGNSAAEDSAPLLLRILGHLKPSGFLRIWPVDQMAYYRHDLGILLERLLREGQIASYEWKRRYLVIEARP